MIDLEKAINMGSIMYLQQNINNIAAFQQAEEILVPLM